MTRRLERAQLLAEVASLEAMLKTILPNDLVGRLGFESRLEEARGKLAQLDEHEERLASVALYFGGEPVFGSRGIRAEFGSTIIASYQDLIAKVWATLAGGNLSLRGQIRDKDAAQLHITNLVHGSFGFRSSQTSRRSRHTRFPTQGPSQGDRQTSSEPGGLRY
ncbi:MAG TPA: hypothetical protein VFQ79_01245 [Bryobacteraceae bacterium]|nr:hypothetical protein [Bryobacteraceae bacterium]